MNCLLKWKISAFDDCILSPFIYHVCVVSLPSTPDSCLWVAVLEGKVVGVVAAVGQRKPRDAVELQRMSVDRNFRRCGVGVALGRKVLEFAVAHRYSTVILGTTAYTPAAHLLYQRLGFHCVGVTNGYTTPGARWSLLEQIFYRVCHHHYSLDVQNITSNGQHWPYSGSADNLSEINPEKSVMCVCT